MFGVQKPYKYRLVQAAWAQTSGHGEQALPEASGLLIRLSRKALPTDHLFLQEQGFPCERGKCD